MTSNPAGHGGKAPEADIPFTQYLLPHGRRRAERIARPVEIADLAQQFIAAGGRYECEILTTGHVSLTAVMDVDDEPQDVEIVLCQNGPGIPDAVDRLVRASIAHIDAAHATESGEPGPIPPSDDAKGDPT